MHRLSTLSPRNSRRSYESTRSAAHEVWVKTCRMVARSSCSASDSSRYVTHTRTRPGLGAGRLHHEVDRVADGLDLGRLFVADLDAELLFRGHLVFFDAEGLDEDPLDVLEHLFAGHGRTSGEVWLSLHCGGARPKLGRDARQELAHDRSPPHAHRLGDAAGGRTAVGDDDRRAHPGEDGAAELVGF